MAALFVLSAFICGQMFFSSGRKIKADIGTRPGHFGRPGRWQLSHSLRKDKLRKYLFATHIS
jgi:hypothetical protein